MPTDQEIVHAAIDIRTRYQRRLDENRSASERLADFARLQQASFRVLRESPDGYQHFLRRNLQSRRVEVIDELGEPTRRFIAHSTTRRCTL